MWEWEGRGGKLGLMRRMWKGKGGVNREMKCMIIWGEKRGNRVDGGMEGSLGCI